MDHGTNSLMQTHSWGFEWVLVRELQIDAEDTARVRRVFLHPQREKKERASATETKKKHSLPIAAADKRTSSAVRTGPASMAFQCMRSSSTAPTVHHSGEFFSNSASSCSRSCVSLKFTNASQSLCTRRILQGAQSPHMYTLYMRTLVNRRAMLLFFLSCAGVACVSGAPCACRLNRN